MKTACSSSKSVSASFDDAVDVVPGVECLDLQNLKDSGLTVAEIRVNGDGPVTAFQARKGCDSSLGAYKVLHMAVKRLPDVLRTDISAEQQVENVPVFKWHHGNRRRLETLDTVIQGKRVLHRRNTVGTP